MKSRLAALVAAFVVAAAVLATLVIASPAGAATSRYPTIWSSRHHVLQRDAVKLGGRAHSGYVRIYRKLGHGHYHRIKTVRVRHGRYQLVVHPVAARSNRFKAGHGHSVLVRSSSCAPLSGHGHVAVWLQDEGRLKSLSDHWPRLICSAARRSTISLAAMFIYDDGPAVDRIISALRKVHRYRHVQVRVMVQHAKYHSGYKGTRLRHLLNFATLHMCERSCHSSSTESHMHDKFTLLSRTIFGRPALMETTANLSTNHLVGQRSSGVYVYDNPTLTNAYAREWRALVDHSSVEPAIWRGAGWGVSYSFDPHTVATDPIATELSHVTCTSGDFVEVVNADITRYTLIKQLNRLRHDGCRVRAVREFHTSQPRIQFPIRRIHLHDKFVLIDAHNSGHHLREVVTGSEDYRLTAMTLSDQQLLRLRRDSVYWVYRHWFDHLWAIADH